MKGTHRAPLKILQVQEGSDPSSVLLLLHGIGGNEQSVVSLAEGADGRFQVISVRAALKIGPSAYAWYPTQFGPNGPVIDVAEAEKSRRHLVSFLEEFSSDRQPRNLFLMGFSQGAIMSVLSALSAPSIIQAVVGFSGRLPAEFEHIAAPADQLRRTRIWLGHGLKDKTLPIAMGRAMQDTLRRFGATSSLTEYDAAHQITPGMLKDAHAWLSTVLDEAELLPRS